MQSACSQRLNINQIQISTMASVSEADRFYEDSDITTRVWLCRDDVIDQLRVSDVIDYLRQENVLTESEEEVVMAEKTTKDKAKVLLDMTFRKGQKACICLLKDIRKSYKHLHKQIIDTVVSDTDRRRLLSFVHGLQTGNCATAVDATSATTATFENPEIGVIKLMKSLRNEMGDFYNQEYKFIRPVPWNDEVLLRMSDFYSDVTMLDITSASNKKQTTHTSEDPDNQAAVEKSMTLEDIDDVFKDNNDTTTLARRILVEGEPGIGKSTLCRKMALDWANKSADTSCKPWTKRFYQVVLLSSDSVQDSLASSVFRSILPEDISGMSEEQLELLFLDSRIQEKTLIMIDAYDETSERSLIHDIWNGKVLRKATVLITSRSGQAPDLMKGMDKRCSIQGFSEKSREKYIKDYITKMKCSSQWVDSVNKSESLLGALTYTPLYVSLLCMLLEENVDIPKSKTKLLIEVVDLAQKRASSKYNMDTVVMEECIDSLSKFALDTLCEPIMASEKASPRKDAIKLGFLVNETGRSKLRPSKSLRFVHKVFQEYFAARYLSTIEYSEMVNGMARLDKENRKSVLIFLAGMAAVHKNWPLDIFYRDLVCRNFPDELYNDHILFHTGLQCLAETGPFNDIGSLLDRIVPKEFRYCSVTCTHCMSGLAIACNISSSCCDIFVDPSDKQIDKGTSATFQRECAKINSFKSIVFEESFSFDTHIMESLMMFQEVLRNIHHLYIYVPDCYAPPEPTTIANETTGMCVNNLQSVVCQALTFNDLVCHGKIYPHMEKVLTCLLDCHPRSLKTIILQGMSFHTSHICAKITPNAKYIKAFVLNGVFVGVSVFNDLCQSLSSSRHLKHLEIQNCGEYAIEKLTPKQLHKLRAPEQTDMLYLMQNYPKIKSISQELPPAIYQVIASNCLETLIINNQHIDGSRLIQSLQRSLGCLTRMDISFTTDLDSSEQMHKLRQVFGNNTLSSLTLRNLKTDYPMLFRSLRNSLCLKQLNLSHNPIGDISLLTLLSEALSEMPELKDLSLEACGITDETLGHILPILASTSLERLSLDFNQLFQSEDACLEFVTLLQSITSLVDITLPMEICTDTKMEIIVQELQGLQKLCFLKITTQKVDESLEIWQGEVQDSWSMERKLLKLIPHLQSATVEVMEDILKPEVNFEKSHSYFRDICLRYALSFSFIIHTNKLNCFHHHRQKTTMAAQSHAIIVCAFHLKQAYILTNRTTTNLTVYR